MLHVAHGTPCGAEGRGKNRDEYAKGVKASHCTKDINKEMHSKEGNRTRGYIIAAWNAGRNLIGENNFATDKITKVKDYLTRNNLHALAISEADLCARKWSIGIDSPYPRL